MSQHFNNRFWLQGKSAILALVFSSGAMAKQDNTLNLSQYLQIVTGNNLQIQSGALQLDISRFATEEQQGAFDIGLWGSWTQEENEQRNTVQESLSRSSLSEFDEKNKLYSLGVYKKSETGATLELEFNRQDLKNSVQPGFAYGRENVFNAEVRIRQPLLKGNWLAATLERDVAQKGEEVAYQSFRQLRLTEVNKAIQAYWDFYQTQGNLNISQHSIDLLEDMLEHGLQRTKMGLIPMTDVMEIESRLASERAVFSHSKQQYIAAMNTIKDFMAITSMGDGRVIQVGNADFEQAIAQLSAPVVNRESSLDVAKVRNPILLSSRYAAEQEGLKLVFAKNQSLMSLDVVASYRLNGLDKNIGNSIDDAFSGQHFGYTVGVEFNIPLTNHLGRGKLGAAKTRKQMALYAIRDNEIKLSNQVDTLTDNIRNKYENLLQLQKVKEVNAKLFEINNSSYEKGKVSIDDVIKSERRLEITRAELLAAYIGYQKAIYQLKEIEGSLLIHFDIEEPLSSDQILKKPYNKIQELPL